MTEVGDEGFCFSSDSANFYEFLEARKFDGLRLL
jgi:hypothetical protein